MDPVKSKFLLGGAAVLMVGIVLGTALWLKLGPRPHLSRSPLESNGGINQYGSVPDFSLTERSGAVVDLNRLRGKIWIADFIYTTCTDTCPLQTATMAKLQDEFAGSPDIHLVSFSVDPERDTPQVLTAYADKYRADDKRWFFLTGPREQIIRLVRDGFHLAVAALPSDADANGVIPHSARFVLVDKEGQIRGYYDSRDSEAVARLGKDIDVLVKG